ncbi:MAG: beta-glucuronidase [Clostridia bacterium]|nr:beta-glucuronidase [Clostridia bacterium]
MSRMFLTHHKRAVSSLDGAWRFSTDPQRVGDSEAWQGGLRSFESVIVPSVWNTKLGLLDYEGVAWYEREFYTEGGTLRFCFGAVMTKADVFLDGVKITSHYGGFCEFYAIVTNVSEGVHRLTVRVDNSFDSQSIPMTFVDWYHYGGITRSVSVERLSGLTILSNRMEYELSDDMTSAKARVALELYSDSDVTDTVCVELLGKRLALSVTLSAGECREVYTDPLDLSGFELWSPECPKLYELKIASSSDDLYDRVGFRKVSVEDGKIKLNGKEIELLGVNRHEEHPDFGFAFPESAMRRDIDIAFDMGCNTLRGSHYPNSQTFVDMLDEVGMLFWSEIPIWGCGFSPASLADPVVLERGAEMHREMTKYYYNHPSIIIWGMHNEIPSNKPESVGMASSYYKLLKERGGNRIVTFASNHAMDDLCMEYCDIICLNQYEGWYGGSINTWDTFIDNFRIRRDELGYAHKPVVVSEFGAASVYGHRSFDTTRWSEDYQAELIGHCLELFHADPMVVGMYIWQFTDMRTSLEAGLTRARGFNNKGVLNEHRNPKAAFFKAKELYHKFKN